MGEVEFDAVGSQGTVVNYAISGKMDVEKDGTTTQQSSLVFKVELWCAAAPDEAKQAALNEYTAKFLGTFVTLCDHTARLVSDADMQELRTGGVHDVLGIAKRFKPIPEWLRIDASGSFQAPAHAEQPAAVPAS